MSGSCVASRWGSLWCLVRCNLCVASSSGQAECHIMGADSVVVAVYAG